METAKKILTIAVGQLHRYALIKMTVHIEKQFLKKFFGYALTLVLPIVIVRLQYSLGGFFSQEEWIFLYPFVFISAWLGGFTNGLSCTMASSLSVNYFLVETPSASNFISAGIFSSMSILMSLLVAQVRNEKKTAKEARELAKSRSFLDSLLENIPNMVFVKDAKDLRFIRFNKACENVLGFNRNEMIGKNDYDFFPKEQADFFVGNDRNVISSKELLDIPEETIQTKVLGERILHTKKIPIYNANGEPEYLLGIAEDITEFKKKEQEILRMTAHEAVMAEKERNNRKTSFLGEASTVLASSLDYHKTLVQLAHITVPTMGDWCIISIITEKGEYKRIASVHANPEKQVFLDEFNDNYSMMEVSPNIIRTINEGSSLLLPVIEEDLIGKDRGERFIEIIKELGCTSCIVVPICNRGKALGAMTIVSSKKNQTYTYEDLTLAEELARRAGISIDNSLLYTSAQEAIRARDEFISIASHELKTPITSLKLQFQMASRGPGYDSEKLSRMLNRSNSQIDHLSNLIEGLLDVSRIQTGRLSIHKEELGLTEVIHVAVERFNHQLNNSGCTLSLNLDNHLTGYWDRMRIEQIVLNLLSNAAKYAQGSKIEIRTQKTDGMAIISVCDSGPGVLLEKHGSIFERFERGSHSREISGLGLGLYIVRQIAEAHGGLAYLDTEITKGARFVIELPISSTKELRPASL